MYGDVSEESNLFSSVLNGNLSEVQEWMSTGMSPNCLLPGGVTPFHLAVGHEEMEVSECMTRCMLEHGANPNVRSIEGSTPLHIACAYGRCDLVWLLLQHEGDPTLLDQDGSDCLENARESGCDLCQALISQNLHERRTKSELSISDDSSNTLQQSAAGKQDTKDKLGCMGKIGLLETSNSCNVAHTISGDSTSSFHTCSDQSHLDESADYRLHPTHTQIAADIHSSHLIPSETAAATASSKHTRHKLYRQPCSSDEDSDDQISPAVAHSNLAPPCTAPLQDDFCSVHHTTGMSDTGLTLLPRTSSRSSLTDDTMVPSPQVSQLTCTESVHDIRNRLSCLDITSTSLGLNDVEMPSWDASTTLTGDIIPCYRTATGNVTCHRSAYRDVTCQKSASGDMLGSRSGAGDSTKHRPPHVLNHLEQHHIPPGKNCGDWSLLTSDLDSSDRSRTQAALPRGCHNSVMAHVKENRSHSEPGRKSVVGMQQKSAVSAVADWLGIPRSPRLSAKPASPEDVGSVKSAASAESHKTICSCVSGHSEVFIHREADSDFSVMETRLVPHDCDISSVGSFFSCLSRGVSSHDWQDASIQTSPPPHAIIPREICCMSHRTLRDRLLLLGEITGPVTASTRPVYERRLAHLIRSNPTSISPTPTHSANAVSPQKVGQFKGIPLELGEVLSGGLEMLNSEELQQLESCLIEPFADADPDVCKWREGVKKVCFNYLLLDPRVTQNLPCRARNMESLEGFSVFLRAVFYIGKGTRSRPYAHFKEAAAQQSYGNKQANEKVTQITDIWACGQGVISLHVFQNVIPVEAYTREACMIDALGLQRLTNKCRGKYYGTASSFSGKEARFLGLRFLLKAYNILLHEGERQIRRHDMFMT